MRRLLKVVLSVLVVLVVLAVGGVAYVAWTVQRSFPETSGELTLPGLRGEVDVQRDARGVPTIWADDPRDLFMAQGYVHAQDRFWEMDFRRHVTAGRLAEWFGPDQVSTDAFIRTMGWRRVAAAELPLLEPATRRYLEAYADGVNAYLDTHDGATLSFEHWLLGVVGPGGSPERWTPVDSLAWLKAMAWDLRGNMESEVHRARLLEVLPPERVAQLYPAYPYDRHAPIVAGGEVVDDVWQPADDPVLRSDARTAALGDTAGADDLTGDEAVQALAALTEVGDAYASLEGVLGPPGSGIGSNSWVVAGERTESGLPLLANDPHLGPELPSIWYQANLRCREVTAACPFSVGGFTFAGFPGVIIGHNEQIAWGFTNLDPDVSDLYVERVRDGRVQVQGGGFRALETREETIEVAGEDPVTITVRASPNGPLISDPSASYLDAVDGLSSVPAIPADGGDTSYAVALRWTALEPGRTADAVFALDRATGWDEFRSAASAFEVPSQNMVYADVEGNIGYQAPGRIPIRSSGDGTVPALGWTGEQRWTGYVPFDALPYELNPDRGYVVAANQAVVPEGFPYRLADTWSYGYRSQRIVEMVEADPSITVADMQAMQTDTRNGNAEFLAPRVTEPSSDPFYAEAQALLDDWDFTQPADSAAAAYFNAYWRNLLELTFHDELPEGTWPDGGERWFEVVRAMWDVPADPFWDDVRTPLREVRSDVVEEALELARNELTNRLAKDPQRWEWGRLHTLELEHATFGTSGIGVIESIFNRGPVRLGGGGSIVDATAWNAREGYEVTALPSMRMVVDLADLDASSWVNLTGQSGHPYASTYVDQLDAWAAGDQYPWTWSRAAVDESTTDHLTLVPEPGG